MLRLTVATASRTIGPFGRCLRGGWLQAMTPTFRVTKLVLFGRQRPGWLALGRRDLRSSGQRRSGADFAPRTAAPALAGVFADGA